MSIPLLSRGALSCRPLGTETYSSRALASILGRRRVGINALVGCSSLLFELCKERPPLSPISWPALVLNACGCGDRGERGVQPLRLQGHDDRFLSGVDRKALTGGDDDSHAGTEIQAVFGLSAAENDLAVYHEH